MKKKNYFLWLLFILIFIILALAIVLIQKTEIKKITQKDKIKVLSSNDNIETQEEHVENINYIDIIELSKEDIKVMYKTIFVPMDEIFVKIFENKYSSNEEIQTVIYDNTVNDTTYTNTLYIDRNSKIIKFGVDEKFYRETESDSLPNISKDDFIKYTQVEVEIEEIDNKLYIPVYLLTNLDNIKAFVDNAEIYKLDISEDENQTKEISNTKEFQTIEIKRQDNYSRQQYIIEHSFHYLNTEQIDENNKYYTYLGQEKGALWREEALKRIEKNRKSDVEFVIKDQKGNIIDDDNITINFDMSDNEFKFGTAINLKKVNGEYQNNFDGLFEGNKAISENEDGKLFNIIGSESMFKWSQEKIINNKIQYPLGIDVLNKANENNIEARGHTLWWDKIWNQKIHNEIVGTLINSNLGNIWTQYKENSDVNEAIEQLNQLSEEEKSTMAYVWVRWQIDENEEEFNNLLQNVKEKFENIVLQHIQDECQYLKDNMQEGKDIVEWDVVNEVAGCQYFMYYLYNPEKLKNAPEGDDVIVNPGKKEEFFYFTITNSYEDIPIQWDPETIWNKNSNEYDYYCNDGSIEYYKLIAKCISKLKEINPSTKITVNEYILDNYKSGKKELDAIKNIISGINNAYKELYKTEDKVIDLFGDQYHIARRYNVNSKWIVNGYSRYAPLYYYNYLNTVYNEISSEIDKIAITEYDNKTNDAIYYNNQFANVEKAQYLEDTLISCYSNNNICEFTMWVFNRLSQEEKDAYKKLMKQWLNDRQTLENDEEGTYKTRAYKGKYIAKINYYGTEYKKEIDVGDNNQQIVFTVTVEEENTKEVVNPKEIEKTDVNNNEFTNTKAEQEITIEKQEIEPTEIEQEDKTIVLRKHANAGNKNYIVITIALVLVSTVTSFIFYKKTL